MREILFRAKTIYGDTIFGFPIIFKDNFYMIDIELLKQDRINAMDFVAIKEETLSQFTGLTDKNGKKIFENDIVKWGHFNTIERPIRIAKVEMKPDIRFNSNVGVFQYGEFAYQDTENYLEVIGNKFDNLEL